MNKPKIPFWIAILINANIVIGSAFFLGAPKIAAMSGHLAPFAWLMCGALLLPLVLVFSKLAKIYPTEGGIYVYSRQCLGTFWGFCSGWGYFIGTVAGNAAVIHVFSKKFQAIGSVQQFFASKGISSGLWFDVVLVILFTFFNLMNIEFLERAQIFFAVMKAIPFLLIIVAAPLLFDPHNFVITSFDVSGLFESIPLVLFAYIGIEACCAIADKIEDNKGSRAILWSFGIIVSVYTLLQLMLLFIQTDAGADPFMTILPRLTSNPMIITWGNGIIYLAILSSFLGGFYGMFYYNNWNLYAIAKEKNILWSSRLIKLNKNYTPWVCVLAQSALVIGLLVFVKKGSYLITIGDFGVMVAYVLSVLAYLTIKRSITALCALVSCCLLIGICTNNLLAAGWWYIVPFLGTMVLGIVFYLLQSRD